VVSGRPATGAPIGTGPASGGTIGGTSGGTKGGTSGGGTIGGTNGGGTIGGARGGPGSAIGTPAISVTGAHTIPGAAGAWPADVWYSHPPAAATPGVNAMAMPHNPTPAAITLILTRSKIAITHRLLQCAQTFVSRGTDPHAPRATSGRRRQFIGTDIGAGHAAPRRFQMVTLRFQMVMFTVEHG
jgi:hypothetical protein